MLRDFFRFSEIRFYHLHKDRGRHTLYAGRVDCTELLPVFTPSLDRSDANKRLCDSGLPHCPMISIKVVSLLACQASGKSARGKLGDRIPDRALLGRWGEVRDVGLQRL